jgi:hypothetical protein
VRYVSKDSPQLGTDNDGIGRRLFCAPHLDFWVLALGSQRLLLCKQAEALRPGPIPTAGACSSAVCPTDRPQGRLVCSGRPLQLGCQLGECGGSGLRLVALLPPPLLARPMALTLPLLLLLPLLLHPLLLLLLLQGSKVVRLPGSQPAQSRAIGLPSVCRRRLPPLQLLLLLLRGLQRPCRAISRALQLPLVLRQRRRAGAAAGLTANAGFRLQTSPVWFEQFGVEPTSKPRLLFSPIVCLSTPECFIPPHPLNPPPPRTP